ncbi:histidine--tRNA ligase [Sedimentibacter sp. zth1]|uniref:histidine--tRNA ligase n=1 Tax=Sedimentibacter sp. zth1 TaxID=2816908 RepID=UPI001A919DE6|nr:histidine--tRNA ligase [Sedimentibacter sp. zth1]QSX07081.1 histidine--tRNA ligase [Sedimentibacter sp. zth1]
MKVNVNPAKGMRDFLPKEKEIRDYVENVIINTYKQSGFELIETPVIENIENLVSSNGGDNLKLIYKILKRGNKLSNFSDMNESDLSDLGLRYDLTVPLSRFYCNNKSKLSTIFKSLQVGNVFRAERAQKGRYRSFKQCDIDIIGDNTSNAEIELITTTSKALSTLNVNKFSIRINDRRILKGVILSCGFTESEFDNVCIIVDKLDKIGIEGIEKELLAKEYNSDNINKLICALNDINATGTASLNQYGVDNKVIENIDYIINSVKEISEGKYNIVFDFTLVRGMGYYTGTIFEIQYEGLGYSIGGGGRYDKMIGKFIGEDIPAIGFSIGFERLVNQLIEENFKVPNLQKIVLLYNNEDSYTEVVKKANELREKGFSVSTYEKAKKLGKQLSQFETLGFRGYAIFEKDDTNVKDFNK